MLAHQNMGKPSWLTAARTALLLGPWRQDGYKYDHTEVDKCCKMSKTVNTKIQFSIILTPQLCW